MKSSYTFDVTQENAKQRLDKFLADHCVDITRSYIKSLIEEGHVCVNHSPVQEPAYKVRTGDRLQMDIPDPKPADPTPQDIPLTVVYEDDHLLVINKAAGMVVHPAYGNADGTLVNALLHHYGEELSGIRGVKMPGIVHRLDKDTSGLLVVAKSDAAHQGLTLQFQNRTLFRRYLAVVWNVPFPPHGEIHGNIGRNPGNRQKMTIVKYGGKEALTYYRVMETFNAKASLVECRLHSGRTHQIRVHMASIGCPLIGDPVYGKPSKALQSKELEGLKDFLEQHPGQALHAYKIEFIHPLTNELLAFEAPLPFHMLKILDFLKS